MHARPRSWSASSHLRLDGQRAKGGKQMQQQQVKSGVKCQVAGTGMVLHQCHAIDLRPSHPIPSVLRPPKAHSLELCHLHPPAPTTPHLPFCIHCSRPATITCASTRLTSTTIHQCSFPFGLALMLTTMAHAIGLPQSDGGRNSRVNHSPWPELPRCDKAYCRQEVCSVCVPFYPIPTGRIRATQHKVPS